MSSTLSTFEYNNTCICCYGIATRLSNMISITIWNWFPKRRQNGVKKCSQCVKARTFSSSTTLFYLFLFVPLVYIENNFGNYPYTPPMPCIPVWGIYFFMVADTKWYLWHKITMIGSVFGIKYSGFERRHKIFQTCNVFL